MSSKLKNSNRSARRNLATPADAKGFRKFIEEISKHVLQSAVITFESPAHGVQRWDVGRVANGDLRFGMDKFQSTLFPLKFISALSGCDGVGVVLRSFTADRDVTTDHPIKELRAYFVLQDEHNKNLFGQFSAKEVAKECTTEPITRKFLAPERSVVFCGPCEDYLDECLNPINR